MAANASQRRLETLLGHLKGHHHDPSVSLIPTSKTEGSSERELYMMLLIVICTASNYRFTLDNAFLTSSQRQFYEDNGFLVIRRLVPQEQLEIYREHFRKICCGEVKV